MTKILTKYEVQAIRERAAKDVGRRAHNALAAFRESQ